MVERAIYKTIAWVVAIFTYLLFAFLLVSYIKSSKKEVKDFGYNVEEAVVVDLDLKPSKDPIIQKKPEPKLAPTPHIEEPKPTIVEDTKPIDNELKVTTIKEVKPEPKEEEKSNKDQEARDLEAKSAKDLFSTLRAKNYDKVLEERQKQDQARASRLAKQKAKRREREAKKKREEEAKAKRLAAAKALLQDIQKTTATSHKKRGEKDDFWSPVSSKIMSKWNRTISTQDGLMAEVKIKITNQGKLSYRIKRLSNNPLFDTKLKIFLENLEYEVFPKYKDGPYIEATFQFKDQAK